MIRNSVRALVVVAALGLPSTVFGQAVVTGVVTEYQLGNPLLRIYLDVYNNGKFVKFLDEGGSNTLLMRVGWNGEEVKPGAMVTFRGHPPRDTGAPAGSVGMVRFRRPRTRVKLSFLPGIE